MILYRKDNYVYFDYNNQKAWLHSQKVDFAALGPTSIRVNAELNNSRKLIFEGECTDVLGFDGDPYGTTPEEVVLGFNKGFDTNWQDQTTDAVIVKFNLVEASTTLAIASVIGDYTVTVVDATGAVVGNKIIFFNPVVLRFTFAEVLAISGNLITIDGPIDVDYPVGTFVDFTSTNMNLDGSVTPIIFGLRGTGAPPGVDLDVDITRLIFKCQTTNSVDLSKFGDIVGGLLRGLQLRQRSAAGRVQNIFNVKTNGDLAGIMYDWTPYDAQNPNQGQNGFVARFTFGGPEKIGVVVRLPVGTDLEFIIQDDLTDLLLLEVVAEGHIVEESP